MFFSLGRGIWAIIWALGGDSKAGQEFSKLFSRASSQRLARAGQEGDCCSYWPIATVSSQYLVKRGLATYY
jgi:hypothetical protein